VIPSPVGAGDVHHDDGGRAQRIHNRLPGSVGDGGPLDDHARRVYEQTLAGNASEFDSRVREGDVVIVHDPQPGR
jgi:hypothetical protein